MPGHRLLHASDDVVPNPLVSMFASPSRVELDRLVRHEGLQVERVFAEHLRQQRGRPRSADGRLESWPAPAQAPNEG